MPTSRTHRLTWIAFALLFLCALAYSPQIDQRGVGNALLLAGGVVIAVVVGQGASPARQNNRFDAPDDSSPVRWWLAVIGAACIALMALGNTDIRMSIHVQMGLLVGGAVFLVMGLGGGQYRINRTQSDKTVCRSYHDLLYLVPIIGLAFVVRVVDLETSVHFFVDEMHFAEGVANLRDGPTTPLLSPMAQIAAFPRHFAYLQTLAADTVGSNLLGLRLPAAVFGTLTVPAVYLLGRVYVDRRVGLLAALILATFPPHMHFSRLGLNNIADPLFGVLALAFLERGYRRGIRRDFVLAGVMLGLTQYWYEGGKLVYPLMVALWVGAHLFAGIWARFAAGLQPTGTDPTPTIPRLRLRQMGMLALIAGIMAAPMFYVNNALATPSTPRLREMAVSTERLLQPNGADAVVEYLNTQFAPAIYHFVEHRDTEATPDPPFYYGGHTALILPLLLPFFLAGAWVLLWRGRFAWPVLLLITAGGNSLLNQPDWTARFVVTFPFLVVITAVGAVWLWDHLPVPGRWRGAVRVVVVLALLSQIAYYFGPHLSAYNGQLRPFRDHQDVGWRVADLPADTTAYLFTDELTFYGHILGMERYWGRDLPVTFVSPWEMRLRSPSRLPYSTGPLAFFLPVDDRQTLNLLARSFDLDGPHWSPYRVPEAAQYVLYLARGGD